ncbi:hypothetical protein A5707_00035 [Mycobacterium kyorinense]|uniref:DUF2784 domain-containing protein n=1 Tax=Mycobacterium kyorinense TaxID=487514 RepID=A0A1A2ZY24_9MYCO|nr:DUF2784 domain-containing protein [Mycobacterium kyorinense]OBI53976.1 hypothetical protein A5707_00035 [Mycobacterium kyorinense]
MYEILVALAVAVHFAFIAYLMVGGFLALRWRRTIWLHAVAVVWGVGSAAGHVGCPLTGLERWARTKAGMAPLPSEGFIAHYITGVLYPAGWLGAMELALFAVVVASWTLYAWRSRQRDVANAARRPSG